MMKPEGREKTSQDIASENFGDPSGEGTKGQEARKNVSRQTVGLHHTPGDKSGELREYWIEETHHLSRNLTSSFPTTS